MKKLNLPNKLTLARLILVPFYVTVMLLNINETAKNLISAGIFALTALTDFLDGRIARKKGLITDFGRFLDPVADKIMIFGAMMGLLYMHRSDNLFFISLSVATFIFFVRETAVTTLRMIVSTSSGDVIAAGFAGKIKTGSQIGFVMSALIEPFLMDHMGYDIPYITYLLMAFMTAMTLISGIEYFKGYFKYIDPEK